MASLIRKVVEHRLPLSFLLVAVVLVIFGSVILEEIFTLSGFTQTIYEHPLVVSNSSLLAALNLTKMHRSMKDVVLSNSPAELRTALEAVTAGEKEVYRQLDVIQRNILGDEGKVLAKQTRYAFTDWTPIREEVVRLLEAGDRETAILITKERGAAHVAELEKSMLALTLYARDKATGFLMQAMESQSKLEKIVRLTVVFVIMSSMLIFFSAYRVLRDEKALLAKTENLQAALDEIKTLQGIIPICSNCRQVRDDKGLWKRMEEYICAHTDAEISHSICPDCARELYPEQYERLFSHESEK